MPPMPAARISGWRAETPRAIASAASQTLEIKIVVRSAAGLLRAARVITPIAMSLPPPSLAIASPWASVLPKRSARSAGCVAKKIPRPMASRLAPIPRATCRAVESIGTSLPTSPVRDHGVVAEGDTILRLARRFESTLLGETVAASAPNPRGKAARIEQLDGRRLEGIESRGKHLLLDFGDLSLHSHLGMSGGWHFYP